MNQVTWLMQNCSFWQYLYRYRGHIPFFYTPYLKKKSPFQKELHKKDETPQTVKLNWRFLKRIVYINRIGYEQVFSQSAWRHRGLALLLRGSSTCSWHVHVGFLSVLWFPHNIRVFWNRVTFVCMCIKSIGNPSHFGLCGIISQCGIVGC